MYLNSMPDIPTRVFITTVAVDIETTGLDLSTSQILSVAFTDGHDTYILTEEFERIIPILEDESILKIFHNALFDLSFIMKAFSCEPVKIWDTMLADEVLYAGHQIGHALDEVLAARLGVLIDKEVRKTFIDHEGALTEEQLHYIEEDVKYLIPLYENQRQEASSKGLGRVIGLENRCLLSVIDMYLTGVGFDTMQWEIVKEEIRLLLDNLRNQIMYEDLGEGFAIDVPSTQKGQAYLKAIELEDINFGSHKQDKAILNKLGMKVHSTDRKVLDKLVDRHPFVAHLIEYRDYAKIITWHWQDFLDSSGRLHPDYNQIGTVTGRPSCAKPNMFQIPRPEPDRPNLRVLFRPLEGHLVVDCDYSQQEPRIQAHLSQDPAMVKAANEVDIYIAFAKAIWHEDIDRNDPRRQLIKTFVLATSYGSQAKGLSAKLRMSLDDTQRFMNEWIDTFPVAWRWSEAQLGQVIQKGYSLTAYGRKIYFPTIQYFSGDDLWRFRNDSKNYPIQGTGADMLKLAQVLIYDRIRQQKLDAHQMISPYDELVFTARADQAEEIFALVKGAMEEAGRTICPSVKWVVEGSVGEVWAH